jgi:hypothetical protein
MAHRPLHGIKINQIFIGYHDFYFLKCLLVADTWSMLGNIPLIYTTKKSRAFILFMVGARTFFVCFVWQVVLHQASAAICFMI